MLAKDQNAVSKQHGVIGTTQTDSSTTLSKFLGIGDTRRK